MSKTDISMMINSLIVVAVVIHSFHLAESMRRIKMRNFRTTPVSALICCL